jgi:hypothetical protein
MLGGVRQRILGACNRDILLLPWLCGLLRRQTASRSALVYDDSYDQARFLHFTASLRL